MSPLAASGQKMHVLAPVLLAHHPKAFHAFGITHHFTGDQGAAIIVVLGFLLVLAVLGWALRS